MKYKKSRLLFNVYVWKNIHMSQAEIALHSLVQPYTICADNNPHNHGCIWIIVDNSRAYSRVYYSVDSGGRWTCAVVCVTAPDGQAKNQDVWNCVGTCVLRKAVKMAHGQTGWRLPSQWFCSCGARSGAQDPKAFMSDLELFFGEAQRESLIRFRHSKAWLNSQTMPNDAKRRLNSLPQTVNNVWGCLRMFKDV